MNERQYELIITYSDDDHAYIVEVPELPGCMADGPTRALGRPIPTPRQPMTN
jgi:predicted RNase H-like HicB family nuclease